jgi:replicative DNA helicase
MLANVGVERAIIASICQYGKDALIEVEDIGVHAESFTQASNQALFTCLKAVLERHAEIDQALLLISIKEAGYQALFDGRKDIEYIGSLFTFPIVESNIRPFAIKLERLAVARKAIQQHRVAIESLEQVSGNESIDDIIAMSENPIFDLIMELNKSKDKGPHVLFEDIEAYVQHLRENKADHMGIATPWRKYNAAIGGGLRSGGVNLISARPKIGKTTLGKELLLHCSNNLKIPALFLDTEMCKEDQIIRSLASTSGVALQDIETGNFENNHLALENVERAVKELKKNKLLHYESIAGKSFDEVLAVIRRWIVKCVGYDENGNTNKCIVVYDYFKLMDKAHLENLKEYEAMGYQISKLTDFAKQYSFPVLAFVQLNRQHEVSQSDRLIWICHSFSKFATKEDAERTDDGEDGGNRKLEVCETRFGGGLDDHDYICMNFERTINRITEVGLASEVRHREQRNRGEFERVEGNVVEETPPWDDDNEETLRS